MILILIYISVLGIGTYHLNLESPIIGLFFLTTHLLLPFFYFASVRRTVSRATSRMIQNSKKLVNVYTYYSPTVTVIIPSHNCVKYLREAVESALASVGVRVSVLIIDDQSTDGSLELASKLASIDSRVRVVRNHRSRGAYFCRNVGLQLATSEFIAFLDSDDWQDKERLQQQISPLLLNRKVRATYCLTQRWSEDLSEPIGIKLQLCHISAVFRRSLLEKVGFFDTVRFGADTEFRSRLISTFGAESIQTINTELYRARIRPKSLTSSGAGAHLSIEDGKLVHTPNDTRYRYRDSYRFWHTQEASPYVAFPQIRRSFSVEIDSHNTSPFIGERVIGFISINSKNGQTLNKSILSLLPQLDVLHVILNHNTSEPKTQASEKLQFHVLTNGSSENDFANTISEVSGYILLLDENLQYPSNYVSRILTEIEVHDREAIVGAKALILPRDNGNKGREHGPIVLHESSPSNGEWADLLGSGTIGFHSQTFKPTDTQLINTSTDDYTLASQAASDGIPLLSISRPRRWILKRGAPFKDQLTRRKPQNTPETITSAFSISKGDHPRSILGQELLSNLKSN